MEITVNGQARELPEGATLADLLAALGLRVETVAVARNGEVVPRARLARCPLQPGDRVEIVRAVGGG